MEVLLEILIRASISIAVFYALYWLLLRQSTHFTANRIFLLISLLISVVLAVVPVQYQVLIPAPASPILSEYSGVFNHDVANTSTDAQKSNGIGLFGVLLLIYSIGAAIVLLRLLLQCRKPILIITKSKPKKIYDCLIHENKVFNSPFSFFNRILINPEYFQQDEIYDILTHEKVHIQERHWIDLFIIELLTVFFWFNPFIWFFEQAIKRNHEYLADEGVLSRGHSPVRYQALLINRLMGTQVIGLANHFSSSLGLTRFKMMTKEKTAKRKMFRMIWGVPVLAILLMAFAKPEYQMQSQKDLKITTNTTTNTVIVPDGEEYKVELSDGTKVFLSGNSKLEYPEKFADNERVIYLEGEAYFEVSESNVPFFVKNQNGKMIGPIGSNGKKTAVSTVTGHAYIPNQTEKSIYVEYKEQVKLSGKVIDEKGNPLTGASIVLRKTTTGTVVDRDGTFELNIPKSKKMDLVISFVGYKTIVKEIDPTKKKQNFDITMTRGVVSIDGKSLFFDGDVPPPVAAPTPEFDKNSDKPTFFIVEEMPDYKQGSYGLGQYIKKQKSKLQNKFGEKLNGTATVGFTVDANGKVRNIQILDKSNDIAAKAATKIASEMENWKPGSQRGKAVPVDFALELEF
jgi:beta-lactamase regulating signal transducer with metallopeptidase domain